MPQDFWASSGFAHLQATPAGLVPSGAWFGLFLARDELRPPPDAGPRERAMHARLSANPLAVVAPEALEAVEDPDARENWSEFLRFRERVRALGTLEAAYLDLFRRPQVDLAPPFIDAMACAITRALLDGCDDPWLMRAGELFFRRQRVSTDEGRVLLADATTIETYHDTGGFGVVGRLLKQQNTPVPEVKMDVLNAENAPFYFLRDELFSFVLDASPGSEGAAAIARVIERWVARMAGVRATATPLARIDDERWRWHVGLDVDATAILNGLYRGETVPAEDLERLVLLLRLDIDPAEAVIEEMRGRPVYLGLACRPDRTLKLKPQNLVTSLPLTGAH